jgi:hypothetical protein
MSEKATLTRIPQVLVYGLIALPLVALFPLQAFAGGNGVFTGTFEGSGRACYGKLVIRPEAISWNTPFSSCRDLPYEIIDQKIRGSDRRITYLLKKRNKECLFSVISLHQGDSPEPDLGWEATGYLSVDDFKADSTANSTSCPLVQTK